MNSLSRPGSAPEVVAGEQLVDPCLTGPFRCAAEQDRYHCAGAREHQAEVHRQRGRPGLGEQLPLDLAGLAVPRLENRLDGPPVAAHALIDYPGRLRHSERSGVHEREVGGVEKVVHEEAGAGRGADHLTHAVDKGRVVPLGEVEPSRRRPAGGHPHHAVALVEPPRDLDRGPGRRRLVRGRDLRAPAVDPEAPAVIAALDALAGDPPGRQRGQSVGAAVDPRRRPAGLGPG